MKIEAGKYYRMRCGGAVKIDHITTARAYSTDDDWYNSSGRYYYDRESHFDLLAEITEAEYNRILSGEHPDDSAYEAYLQSEAAKQIEALKAENEGLKAEVLLDLRRHAEACGNNARIRNDRRFEAAKAAMQGFCANPDNTGHFENLAADAINQADALLKALEETK